MQKKLKLLGELSRFEGSDYIFQDRKYNSFIYPSVCNGKIVKLLKILFSNKCKFNCFYCANRKDRDCPRYSFQPEELANIFYLMWKKGYVSGLFLSSGIDGDTNEIQEKMIETTKILRKKLNYQGYIHLKILPGVDDYLIKKATNYADRLSINLESISPFYIKKISNEKDFFKNLLNTLKKIYYISQTHPLKNGITSQIIVGSAEEKDREILNFSYYIYKNYNLQRIYYSAFVPVLNTPFENKKPCKIQREVRLYQADILIRKYKFLPSEIPFDEKGNLYLEKDPKKIWAERNKEFFPVEINKADFYELIRVPGIGLKGAKKIIEIRKEGKIYDEKVLRGIGIKLEKASSYILLNGRKIKGEKEKEESEIVNTIFDELL